jgi:NAD(P)-dependent dehydrogenase (short-subunit alcohol dehydrogenase family)
LSFAHYPSLSGRHCLITGGATGIGETLVEEFSAQGAIVSFLDKNEDAGRALDERVARSSGAAHFVACDLTDVPALQSSVETAIAAHGPVRVLVNNAANDERHCWRDITAEDWDRSLQVNLRHQFFAIQAVADSMAAAGGGSIIDFSSISWMLGMAGLPAYVTAKSAVIGLTRSFARDLGSMEIRVNCVIPGWIITDKQRELYLSPMAEEKLLEEQCLKRLLLPTDVARMVLFLAADDSAGCTGQSFVVDGGWR